VAKQSCVELYLIVNVYIVLYCQCIANVYGACV